jgi:3-deoxy-manno-octulosonate cytidylyltransferase (CMP-KDO synthetase)
VATKEKLKNKNSSLAISFKRNHIFKEEENIYHHIGIYAYKAKTLKKFIDLDQSKNEIKSRLEQLRALDNNLQINVTLSKSSPIGVDTKEDYVALKKIMEYKS